MSAIAFWRWMVVVELLSVAAGVLLYFAGCSATTSVVVAFGSLLCGSCLVFSVWDKTKE